jgi:hypothetical protein
MPLGREPEHISIGSHPPLRVTRIRKPADLIARSAFNISMFGVGVFLPVCFRALAMGAGVSPSQGIRT